MNDLQDENEGRVKGLLSTEVLPLSIALMLSSALVAFEGLSITAALPEIGADLGNLDRLPWIITGYLLLSGLTIAMTGGWVDAVGPRLTFRVATIGFAASSLACAVAMNLETLIAARLIQGASGGMTMATTGAAIGLAYPAHLRSRAYAMASTIWGLVAFGGPVLVAALLTFASWRSVFHASVVLAVATLAIGWRALPGPLPEKLDRPLSQRLRFDGRGVFLIAVLSTVTLVGLSSLGRWSAPAALLATFSAWLYWRHTGETPEPVLDRRHFAQEPFRSLAIVAGLTMAAGIGVEAYLPLYLRAGRGASTACRSWLGPLFDHRLDPCIELCRQALSPDFRVAHRDPRARNGDSEPTPRRPRNSLVYAAMGPHVRVLLPRRGHRSHHQCVSHDGPGLRAPRGNR